MELLMMQMMKLMTTLTTERMMQRTTQRMMKWMTQGLLTSRITKNKLSALASKKPTAQNKQNFTNYRNLYNNEKRGWLYSVEYHISFFEECWFHAQRGAIAFEVCKFGSKASGV